MGDFFYFLFFIFYDGALKGSSLPTKNVLDLGTDLECIEKLLDCLMEQGI